MDSRGEKEAGIGDDLEFSNLGDLKSDTINRDGSGGRGADAGEDEQSDVNIAVPPFLESTSKSDLITGLNGDPARVGAKGGHSGLD